MSWGSGRKRGEGLGAPVCSDVSSDRGAKATQKTLGNLLARIQIALSPPILIDDVVAFGELREELKRLVEKNENWDGQVCKLQDTETKPNTVEVRAPVSSLNASKNFDLRCEMRKG